MATELADGLWWFDLRGVNAYLVDDGGTLTLVDAGAPWNTARLVGGLGSVGYDPRDVDRVLVTHYDVDHVGGLGKLPGLDATVYVGREDASLLSGQRTPKFTSAKGFLQRVTRPFVTEPAVPIEPVDDGDDVGSFTAYHTPGHTAGHIVYVSEAQSVAFLGDLVMERNGELHIPPRILNDDTARARVSARAFADRTPDFEVAAMGHGVPFSSEGSQRLATLCESFDS